MIGVFYPPAVPRHLLDLVVGMGLRILLRIASKTRRCGIDVLMKSALCYEEEKMAMSWWLVDVVGFFVAIGG